MCPCTGRLSPSEAVDRAGLWSVTLESLAEGPPAKHISVLEYPLHIGVAVRSRPWSVGMQPGVGKRRIFYMGHERFGRIAIPLLHPFSRFAAHALIDGHEIFMEISPTVCAAVGFVPYFPSIGFFTIDNNQPVMLGEEADAWDSCRP